MDKTYTIEVRVTFDEAADPASVGQLITDTVTSCLNELDGVSTAKVVGLS